MGKRGDLRQTDGIAKQFRATIVDGLTKQLDEVMPLVLCGPGRNRDRMMADLKAAGHRRPMMSIGTTMGGRGAANEVLREGLAGDMLAQHRMVGSEIGLLEEAWQRISTNGAVAYGLAEIQRATEEGAVETLLIGADVLRGTDGADAVHGPALRLRWRPFPGRWCSVPWTTMQASN